jgi:hypothetical protein
MTEERRQAWAWVPDKSDLFRGPPPPPLIAPFVRWDANFYLAIANGGYPERPPDDRPVYAVAFFPLYPLAVRALAMVVGDLFWAAILVANAFALWASLLLFKLGGRYGSVGDGLRAALLLLIAPGSHFLSFPYPEAMFVAFVAAGLLAIREDKLWWAAGWGALACATRSAGVVIAVCLLYVAWQRRSSLAKSFRAAIAAGLSLSGVAAFAAFCSQTYGDPLAFAHIQARYLNERSIKLLSGPIQALFAFNVDPDYYLVTLVAIVLCIRMVRRASAVETLTAWFLLLLPLWTGTLKAMIRYQSVNVGLLLGAARTNSLRAFAVLCIGSAILLVIETVLFSMGMAHY